MRRYNWAGHGVTEAEFNQLTDAPKPQYDTPLRRQAQTAYTRWQELDRKAREVEAQFFSAVIGRDITDVDRYVELMDRG